ncbi:MAG: hypothetical protein V4510_10880 [bacterium]
MADGAGKPTGAWAVAQLCLAVATVAWAALLFIYPGPNGPPTAEFHRDAFWPGATLAAGVFFLVAFVLMAKDHPDSRIVALFGLAIFAVTNGLLAYDRQNVATTCTDALGNDYACNPFQGARFWTIVGASAVISALEIMLLVTITIWESRSRRRALDDARDAEEAKWT